METDSMKAITILSSYFYLLNFKYNKDSIILGPKGLHVLAYHLDFPLLFLSIYSRILTFRKTFLPCFIESPLKMMKNAFYFILKALFVLKIFKFLF